MRLFHVIHPALSMQLQMALLRMQLSNMAALEARWKLPLAKSCSLPFPLPVLHQFVTLPMTNHVELLLMTTECGASSVTLDEKKMSLRLDHRLQLHWLELQLPAEIFRLKRLRCALLMS
jgi:hypothetical protein